MTMPKNVLPPELSVKKPLKRANTSPILPLRSNSSSESKHRLNHGQSVSSIAHGQQEIGRRDSKTLTSFKKSDLGTEKREETEEEPSQLHVTPAIDLLAPPEGIEEMPSTEAGVDNPEDIPVLAAHMSAMDMLSSPKHSKGESGVSRNEENSDDKDSGLGIEDEDEVQHSSARDLLAPPDE